MGRPGASGGRGRFPGDRGQGRGRGMGRGRLGPRAGGISKKPGGDSSAGSSSSSSNKHRSVKNKIRGVERLLKRGGLDPRVRAAKEAELVELTEALAQHQRQELEKNGSITLQIKFFERVKLERAILKLERGLQGGRGGSGKSSGEEDGEAAGPPLDPEAARAKLAALKEDLMVQWVFVSDQLVDVPGGHGAGRGERGGRRARGEKYVSILRNVEDPEAQKHLETERERLRAIVRRQVAEVAAVTEADEGRALLGDKALSAHPAAVAATVSGLPANGVEGSKAGGNRRGAADRAPKAQSAPPKHAPKHGAQRHSAKTSRTEKRQPDGEEEEEEEEVLRDDGYADECDDDFFLAADGDDGNAAAAAVTDGAGGGEPGSGSVDELEGQSNSVDEGDGEGEEAEGEEEEEEDGGQGDAGAGRVARGGLLRPRGGPYKPPVGQQQPQQQQVTRTQSGGPAPGPATARGGGKAGAAKPQGSCGLPTVERGAVGLAAKRARVEGAMAQPQSQPQKPHGQQAELAGAKRPRHAFAAKLGSEGGDDGEEEEDDFFLAADDENDDDEEAQQERRREGKGGRNTGAAGPVNGVPRPAPRRPRHSPAGAEDEDDDEDIRGDDGPYGEDDDDYDDGGG
ncbi:hypothetical protein VOLCADRAFT_98439 [Volvox carteri f. nagariensis]|uniref:rRNA-processing protein EFG1 n=1 Tax=Volvox carteri f. nagariensis TaxID=3068 RepID=D8UFC3_VOLCA|nr:uncharacterized protein VOLCADRAFT_98439 [Volvox carteri f. nagariensis]EFJ41583.1 hypothetical protein VOLCADRAFT_98439 [Volvox carteri f. nagariensis]|eukprot:XP_002957374.1 hypothetical protein VOLCADRAFT_98439 [Volvox carteri f. nagariensis]